MWSGELFIVLSFMLKAAFVPAAPGFSSSSLRWCFFFFSICHTSSNFSWLTRMPEPRPLFGGDDRSPPPKSESVHATAAVSEGKGSLIITLAGFLDKLDAAVVGFFAGLDGAVMTCFGSSALLRPRYCRLCGVGLAVDGWVEGRWNGGAPLEPLPFKMRVPLRRCFFCFLQLLSRRFMLRMGLMQFILSISISHGMASSGATCY